MKKLILLLGIITTLTVSCNSSEGKPSLNNIESKSSNEPVIYTFKNLNFKLNSEYKLDPKNSNKDRVLYTDDGLNSFGISTLRLGKNQLDLDLSTLDNGQLLEYGKMITRENAKDFPDIKFISAKHAKIGNYNAIRIKQESRKVSGNNNIIDITLYCLIANPYYHSIRLGNKKGTSKSSETEIINTIKIK